MSEQNDNGRIKKMIVEHYSGFVLWTYLQLCGKSGNDLTVEEKEKLARYAASEKVIGALGLTVAEVNAVSRSKGGTQLLMRALTTLEAKIKTGEDTKAAARREELISYCEELRRMFPEESVLFGKVFALISERTGISFKEDTHDRIDPPKADTVSVSPAEKKRSDDPALVTIIEGVTIRIPDDFSRRWETDTEGGNFLRVYRGEHLDEDGNPAFDFSCEIKPRHDEDKVFSLSYLEELLADNEYSGDDEMNFRSRKVGFIAAKTVPVSIGKVMVSVEVLGIPICTSSLFMRIVAGIHDEISFKLSLPSERDDKQLREYYKILLELARSVSVNGKDLPVKSVTVGRMEKELDEGDFYASLEDTGAEISDDKVVFDKDITVECPEVHTIDLGEDLHGNDIVFFVSDRTMLVKDYDIDEFVSVPCYSGTLAYIDPSEYNLSAPITVYGLRNALAAKYNQDSFMGKMRFSSLVGSQKDQCLFYGIRIEQERDGYAPLVRLVAGFYLVIDGEKLFYSFASMDATYANEYESGNYCQSLLAAAQSVIFRGNKLSLAHVSKEDLMRTFDLIEEAPPAPIKTSTPAATSSPQVRTYMAGSSSTPVSTSSPQVRTYTAGSSSTPASTSSPQVRTYTAGSSSTPAAASSPQVRTYMASSSSTSSSSYSGSGSTNTLQKSAPKVSNRDYACMYELVKNEKFLSSRCFSDMQIKMRYRSLFPDLYDQTLCDLYHYIFDHYVESEYVKNYERTFIEETEAAERFRMSFLILLHVSSGKNYSESKYREFAERNIKNRFEVAEFESVFDGIRRWEMETYPHFDAVVSCLLEEYKKLAKKNTAYLESYRKREKDYKDNANASFRAKANTTPSSGSYAPKAAATTASKMSEHDFARNVAGITEKELRKREQRAAKYAKKHNGAADPNGGRRRFSWGKVLRILLILLLIGAVCLFLLNNSPKAKKYEEATELFQNGDYKTAAEIFGGLGDYEDSEEQYVKATYNYALELYYGNEFDKAIKEFEKVPDYLNSQVCIDALEWYLLAEDLFSNNYSWESLIEKLEDAANDYDQKTNIKYHEEYAAAFRDCADIVRMTGGWYVAEGNVPEDFRYLTCSLDYVTFDIESGTLDKAPCDFHFADADGEETFSDSLEYSSIGKYLFTELTSYEEKEYAFHFYLSEDKKFVICEWWDYNGDEGTWEYMIEE